MIAIGEVGKPIPADIGSMEIIHVRRRWLHGEDGQLINTKEIHPIELESCDFQEERWHDLYEKSNSNHNEEAYARFWSQFDGLLCTRSEDFEVSGNYHADEF